MDSEVCFLLDMFPNVDFEVIQNALQQGGCVEEAMEILTRSAVQQTQPMSIDSCVLTTAAAPASSEALILQNMFPSTEIKVIEDTLRQSSNDIEKSTDILLNLQTCSSMDIHDSPIVQNENQTESWKFPPPSQELEDIVNSLYQELLITLNEINGVHKIERIRSPLQERKFLEQRACFGSFFGDKSVHLAYHGTAKKNLDSIADLGLLDPNHPKYKVATANRFGKGVYVSKSIAYAKRYARPSLLVVAILEGDHRVLKSNETNSSAPIAYNSILVGQETVLQSNSQILPLFVITFQNGSPANKAFLPSLVSEVPNFNFAEVLYEHIPLAKRLKVIFPRVTLGVLLHLSAQAALHDHSQEWAIDQLTDYNFDDL